MLHVGESLHVGGVLADAHMQQFLYTQTIYMIHAGTAAGVCVCVCVHVCVRL